MSLKPSTRKGPGVLGMAWQANELFIFLVVELVVLEVVLEVLVELLVGLDVLVGVLVVVGG